MKKNFIKLLALILVLGLTAFNTGSDCNFYFPTEKGTINETTFYNAKGKPTGTVQYIEVMDVSDSAGYRVEKVKQWDTNKDTDSANVVEYKVMCKDNEFLMDMSSYMNQEKMQAYKDMDIDITSENISIPANPHKGQMLGDGSVTVKISNEGIPLMTMTVNIKNRKVEALETITTPAGSFDAIKISYETEMHMGLIFRQKGVQWFAKNKGIVRSEVWNKKGTKMIEYSELTKITTR